MATYTELADLVSDNQGVRAKVLVAAIITAKAIPTLNRLPTRPA